MSNLFHAAQLLGDILKTKDLPDKQSAFISQILDGSNDCKKLTHIAKYPVATELQKLKNLIQEEITNTPYLSFKSPHFNFGYLDTLKKVLKSVMGVENQINRKSSPERWNKIASIFDTIYASTKHTYNGTLMLPVNQAFEVRLGDSGGECFGFVAEWANSIIQQQNPFGIPVHSSPPFNPIAFKSNLARKHPELNHLAVLTNKIADYQKLQRKKHFLTEKLSAAFRTIRSQADNMNIDYNELQSQRFYKSLDEVANQLVTLADGDSQKVYNLNVFAYMGGHALGFCKINNKYHFFDSNSGWYRFDNSEDFKAWLPFYFKTLGYDRFFAEYEIKSYSLTNKKVEHHDDDNHEEKKMEVGTVVAFVLLSPFILLYAAYFFTDMFIVRGIRYAALAIKSWFTPSEKTENTELVDTPKVALPKSVEYLDLASDLTNAEKANAKKTARMLDVSMEQLERAQAQNEVFKTQFFARDSKNENVEVKETNAKVSNGFNK